jgi:thiosulfate/3-mercaptopyruvate sulfurtransferase
MSDKAYPYGFGRINLVSTEWLEKNIGGVPDDLMLVDVQPDIHDYIKAHIPGAVYFCPSTLRVPLNGTPGKWTPVDAAQAMFRRIGLRREVPVVVYTGTGLFKGWGDGLEQTMVAYSLARFGHDHVCVLDGGLDKWLEEERPTDQAFPEVEASSFEAEVQSEMFVEYGTFRAIKDDDDVVLLDARPGNVYAGEGPWIRNGHIPGAVNLPWKSLMDPGNARLLKPEEEVVAIVEEVGATADKMIICSCGTGREATNEYLLFKHYLNYPRVKLYEGSFTEWSSYSGNPVVRGVKRR